MSSHPQWSLVPSHFQISMHIRRPGQIPLGISHNDHLGRLVPKIFRSSSPEITNVTFHDKREFSDDIRRNTLEWGDCSGLSRQTQTTITGVLGRETFANIMKTEREGVTPLTLRTEEET